MSKKNSSVILKNGFRDFKEQSKIYLNFKNKLTNLKSKSYAVAISGGPDSLALAALSKAYSYEKKVKFYYLLINHNIRKNSAKEAFKVKKLLKKYKINLKIFENRKKIIKNVQSQARAIRYEILKNFCKKNNIRILITAHNLEDQVETFFIRLSRGSGLTGLSSMRTLSKLDQKVYLYRPFLETQKNSLIEISKKVFGKFIKDPSNLDPKYLRTKIRNLKTPLKKSGIEYSQILKSIKNLASSKDTLDLYVNEILKDIIKKNQNEVIINLNKFNSFNDEIKIRIIHQSIKSLKKNYYNLRSKKVMNLINSLDIKKFHPYTLGGCLFYKKKHYLCLKKVKI